MTLSLLLYYSEAAPSRFSRTHFPGRQLVMYTQKMSNDVLMLNINDVLGFNYCS